MDTQINTAETASYEEVTATTPGQLLKQARNAEGYSIADVASALEMMVTQVRALENDSYLSKPGVAEEYVISALTCYAQLLELNVDRIVSAYHDVQTEQPHQQQAQLASPRRTAPRWLRPSVAALGSVVSVMAITLSLSDITSSPSVADTAPIQTTGQAPAPDQEDLDKLQQEIDQLVAEKQRHSAAQKPRLAKLATLPSATTLPAAVEPIEEVAVPDVDEPKLFVAEEPTSDKGDIEKTPANSKPTPKSSPEETSVYQATDFAKLDAPTAKPVLKASRPDTEKPLKPAKVHSFVAQLYSLADNR